MYLFSIVADGRGDEGNWQEKRRDAQFPRRRVFFLVSEPGAGWLISTANERRTVASSDLFTNGQVDAVDLRQLMTQLQSQQNPAFQDFL